MGGPKKAKKHADIIVEWSLVAEGCVQLLLFLSCNKFKVHMIVHNIETDKQVVTSLSSNLRQNSSGPGTASALT